MAENFFLGIASIITFFVANLSIGNVLLHSQSITNRGDWGPHEKCPNLTFVSGFQLKIESEQPPFHDNTGLNGVRFFCTNRNGETEPTIPPIQSTVGPWGTWRSEFFCNNGLVVGFQLRSEPEQGMRDDSGATNIRILCSDGQIIEGEGTSSGAWTQPQKCRKRQAVCSLQTQVEVSQGIGDDTSLNNLKVECCDVPTRFANCTPSDFWELIAECDNINAFTPTTCSYERKIGIEHSTNHGHSESTSHGNVYAEDVGFSVSMVTQLLLKKFEFEKGVGTTTGYNWTSFKTNTWNHQSTATVSFEVPPGVRSSMAQVVGVCGDYLLRTARFQRNDMLGTPPENASSSSPGNNSRVRRVHN